MNWLKRLWARLPWVRAPGTPGQIAQEEETTVSLGLMEAAANAPGGPTDEQRIFLSQSAVGMRNRVGVLLGIPHRTLPQERELHMIQRELARIEGRAEPAPVQRLGLLGGGLNLGSGLIGSVFGGWQVWAVGGVAILAALGAYKLQILGLEHDRDRQCSRAELSGHTTREPCRDLGTAEANLATMHQAYAAQSDIIEAARNQAAQSSAGWTRERTLRQRFQEEARRIERDRHQADTGGPPEYGFGGVRDDRPTDPAPASSGDNTVANPSH